uniref:Non-haem dioxygenase N-terminal domain-containing protein n=1 Tax=Chenopodium quinoa TaxID=63459 RepID=A0A803LH16_CHEQI
MEEVLQSKVVQEIALSCNGEIPEQFIHKEGFPQSKVDSVSYMDDFVIDLSLVFSPSSPEYDHELGKLRSALSQWGCFQCKEVIIVLSGHKSWHDKVREVGKQFFALPLEEKQKYSRDIDDWNGVIFDLLMKAMARSLNLDDDNCFLKEHGDSVTMFTRFNFYPPCPTPESILGIKPHADGVTFTVVRGGRPSSSER